MNKDFFDNNKLYLKSVVDYKTKKYKKPDNDNRYFTSMTSPMKAGSNLRIASMMNTKNSNFKVGEGNVMNKTGRTNASFIS